MTALEVILLLIGIAAIVVSFFVDDKLSKKDIDKIAEQSQKELDLILEREMKNSEQKIVDKIEEYLDGSMSVAERKMDKECNEKIMAINEYSDTVLESMNKSHSEIMFLYSMLNDKHTDLTNLASELQDFSSNMKNTENEILVKLAEAAEQLENHVENAPEIDEAEALKESVEISSVGGTTAVEIESNHNQSILNLHKEGLSDIEIAKQLGLGLGEIKLVLGLYEREGQV